MITIKNFSFSYLRKQVLKNINLHYSQGNIYFLLGPNGAGKSTLLRSIAGLHRPLVGNIQISNYNAFERNINVLENLYFLSEVVFHQSIHNISERIFFDFVTNEVEAAQALYSEQTYQGFLTILILWAWKSPVILC